jgi:xanthine dehydrogenase YagT iron-sulfur-binding subunit
MEPRSRARIVLQTHAFSVATLMPKSDEPDDASCDAFSRRSFIRAAASSAVALPLAAGAASPPRAALRTTSADDGAESFSVMLSINGQPRALRLDPRTTLLDALRDHAGLTGTKKGCGHGQCGACTVHLDGTRVLACLTLALMAQEREITTIEGLSGAAGELHPMQQAFIDQDAFQCGYCTPGQIMSAVACVREGHAENAADIREYMSGNLCRCAAYPNIVAAIEQARSATKAR